MTKDKTGEADMQRLLTEMRRDIDGLREVIRAGLEESKRGAPEIHARMIDGSREMCKMLHECADIIDQAITVVSRSAP